jgi:hypothetical protein
VVKPVDPVDPRVAETIADWKKTPGTVGIRIMMAAGPLVAPDDPGVNRVLAAAAQLRLETPTGWALARFLCGWRQPVTKLEVALWTSTQQSNKHLLRGRVERIGRHPGTPHPATS